MSDFVIVRNLWKVYSMGSTEVKALRNVSFSVKEGEFFGVVGPSGSGKSTLLHIIGGLDRPTKGEVIVGGIKVNELSENELSRYRNRTVGFVFQMFYLIPRFTALRNVEMPLIARRVPKEERRKRALEALKMVGLEDRAFHKPNQLSGGEQQRVAIARAIVGRPKLLLADEPTGNLDSESVKSVMEVFKKLNKEYNLTVILVTHNLELIWYCDRVIRLINGYVKRIYEPKEYEEMLHFMLKK